MASLDSLLEATTTDPATGGNVLPERTLKYVEPEPGEPPLMGPMPVTTNGQFRRRYEQRLLAAQRRLQFARAYVSSSFDPDKALLAAGYNPSPKQRNRAVETLINHPEVTAEIQRLRHVLEQRTDVLQVDLTQEWLGIASSNVFDYFDQAGETLTLKSKTSIPKAQQRAVKAIKIRRRHIVQKDGVEIDSEEIELTMWDKHAALNALAEIQGLFQQKKNNEIDSLAQAIADRTEKFRKKGVTYEAKVDR